MIDHADELLYPNGHFKRKGATTIGHDERWMTDAGNTAPLPIPSYADEAAMVEALHEDGFVVLPDLLSAQEVDELRTFMDDRADPDDSKYEVPNWCYNRTSPPDFHRYPLWLRYIDRAPLADLARAVLGEDCRVRGGTMWTTGPGRAMPVHMDWQPVALPPELAGDPAFKLPIFWLQCHFYLNDMTLDNGPTVVVPGSHRAGRPPCSERDFNGTPAQAACVPAGSAVIFRSELWHGGMRHTADERRYIVQIQYGHSMLSSILPRWQDSEQWHPDIRRDATPAQRKLLGERRNKHDDYATPKAKAKAETAGAAS